LRTLGIITKATVTGAIFQPQGARITLVQISTETAGPSRIDQAADPRTKRKINPPAQSIRVFATRDLNASTAVSIAGSVTITTETMAKADPYP
jgi:hypothetical protein